jgi:hypothetical protein
LRGGYGGEGFSDLFGDPFSDFIHADVGGGTLAGWLWD